jgi:hypothetical protein
LNTSRALKKGGVQISKTEYADFVYDKFESKFKKPKKFEEVMVQNKKKNLISIGLLYLLWDWESQLLTSCAKKKRGE